MKHNRKIILGRLLVCASFFSLALPALSQDSIWTGQVQCQLSVQANGVTHRETQTWKLTGAAPTMSGAIAVYQAVWSVSGDGTVQRTVNAQVVSGLWKTTVAPTNTNLAFFVRASDNRLVIKSYHAQLYAPAAIVGTQQLAVPGAAPTQRTVQNAAYEWQLPVIEDSATSTSVSGSGSVTVSGNVVSLQATPNGTANCTWQFNKGSAVPVPQTQLAAARVIQPTATVVAQLPTLNRGASASAGAAGAAGATAGAGAAGGGSSSAGAGAAVVPGTQGAAGGAAAGAAAGAAGQNSAGAGGAAAATGSGINYAGNASGSAAAGSAAAGAGGAAGAFGGSSAAGAAPGSAAGASGNSSAATTGGSSGSTNLTRSSLQQGPLQVTPVPTIAQVTPNYIALGHIVPVTITGSFTHFAQGLTSVSFGAPTLIGVTSVKVDSPTSLTAWVSVALAPLPPGVQFSGMKCDLTVVTSTAPASSAQQSTLGSTEEFVTLAGAFWVTPPALPQHPTLATFSPNTGQQGQTMTVTITGTDTNFLQGLTQVKENPLSPIKGASLTVTSPTTAIANFTIPATAVTRTSKNTLVVETNTGQMVETTLGDFTITPMPDSYSHGPNPTSGVDISTTTPQTFDGQLASLSGEDWFWLECDISACDVSLQNVTAPTNIVVDVLDANQVPVVPSVQQANPPTKLAGAGAGPNAFYFLRVRATAWDVSQPKYTLVVAGISQ
jgi:hypothetical protein